MDYDPRTPIHSVKMHLPTIFDPQVFTEYGGRNMPKARCQRRKAEKDLLSQVQASFKRWRVMGAAGGELREINQKGSKLSTTQD